MKRIVVFFTIITCILLHICITQHSRISTLKHNQEALLDSSAHFKIADSLNAIKVANLELSLAEYKKYRPDDADIAKHIRGEKVKTVVKPITKTEYRIVTQVKDTIVYADTLKSFSYTDKWYSVNGYINNDSVNVSIKNYDELLIVESLQKKKFLFFKLPGSIFGYKRKVVNVISKNPNCCIMSSEYVSIK